MDGYRFELEMGVRDYECDMQGIVNNSVYQNYLEHARHEFLKEVGIDFGEYAKRGINLVVVRAELDYRFPLKSGDRFVVGLNLGRESVLRFAFYQDIVRLPCRKSVLRAKIIGTALNGSGRPEIPAHLASLFDGGMSVDSMESSI
ncbi:MAG: acyl-CoA thioesterase [Candidatus Chlorobium antarcticum]|jgi:acyl-CoA thioester hydrolase|nr:acyl-CoA thioesterase [Candidatus Chlorobium antarcticum]